MSDNYFEIDGNNARYIEKRVIFEGTTDALIPLLSRPISAYLMNLPGGLRHIFADGNENNINIVIEQLPMVRHITHNDYSTGRGQTEYDIGIPWTYFVFNASRRTPTDINTALNLTDWYVFGSPTRAMTMDHTLYALPTNNVYRDGRICFGTAAADPGANLGQHLDACVTAFWSSNFNMDVQPNLPFGGYAAWEDATSNDPNCWQGWDWPSLAQPRTLQELAGLTPDRTTPITLTNGIPDLPQNPTFGRALHWFQNDLTSTQQARLRTVLAEAGEI